MQEKLLQLLAEKGQSIWLDNISRSMLKSGDLQQLLEAGLRGLTSNPTIFEKAVCSSSSYDEQIRILLQQGKTVFEIYDALTIDDVQKAADIFLPVYEQSGGLDGYVSLEVNPTLAYKAKETIAEAQRLHKAVSRPNLMLKVPATSEGCLAIEALIACGVNINATLIFSLEQYIRTASAYIKGLRRYIESGGSAASLRSVASVFVSRIDNKVDKQLQELLAVETDRQKKAALEKLQGKAAVANSQVIYAAYRKIFAGADFSELENKGAHPQRVLWGSTSTKNPAYSDIKYVQELIAPDTVNTVPEKTLAAFLDHGAARIALSEDAAAAEAVIKALEENGIEVNAVCRQLLTDGVAAFEKSFHGLLAAIEQKAKQVFEQTTGELNR